MAIESGRAKAGAPRADSFAKTKRLRGHASNGMPRCAGCAVSVTLLALLRGSAIGSTPAFGAGYPGSSPGPGANMRIGSRLSAHSQASTLSLLGLLGAALVRVRARSHIRIVLIVSAKL